MSSPSRASKPTLSAFRRGLNSLFPPSSRSASPKSQAGLLNANPSSPTPSIDGAGGSIWTELAAALRALHCSTEVFPTLHSAIGTLGNYIDVLEIASKNREEYEQFASNLTKLTQLLDQHMKNTDSTQMSRSIANIALSIEQQAKVIQAKCDRGSGRRLLEAEAEQDELLVAYRRIESLFQQLQIDASLSAWSLANEQLAITRLEGLVPAKLANYDSKLSTEISRRTCTEQTRTNVLSDLDDWSNDPNGADVYWMNGMAGTGKTTIACSFSKQLEDRNQLAASFFCTRTSAECRDVNRIVPTIAYQLAGYSMPFRGALCKVLEGDRDLSSKTISKQFERLLKEPLLRVKEAFPSNLVVVIDALDECDGKAGTKLVLDMLFQSTTDLPLKFFVTSRPEPDIFSRMHAGGRSSHSVLYLHNIEESLVQADIHLYLTEELKSVFLSPSEIKQLVERSGKLFIYAATLARYIRTSNAPQKRLKAVLTTTSQSNLMYAEIDQLYTAILTAAFDETAQERDEIEDIQLALRTVLCVQEPVRMDTLAKLSGLGANQIFLALQPVQSVVQFSDGGIVSTLHASFPDFMFDKARSGPFYCDAAQHHPLLAKCCFSIMTEQLRFNICNLESSFIPDTEVQGLQGRMDKSISPPLFYSACYWGHHLQATDDLPTQYTLLNEFLSIRLLFWIEVMNLKQHLTLAVETLSRAQSWLETSAATSEIKGLANDAQNFLVNFAINPVSQCTPHIYISALPFCVNTSLVSRLYQGRLQGTVKVTGSPMQTRNVAALARWRNGFKVCSLVTSPDALSIAIGGCDGNIIIRSLYGGVPLVGPFQAHLDHIPSIAYSPDGTRIASGSFDHTIRVWNVHNVALVLGPLEGHTGRICSVAYSPDGLHITSGSEDHTIRLWSAHDGIPILEPLKGHTGTVNSVAYSPDGTRIISGSDDNTIRVWNAHNGTVILGPLEGHTGGIFSVACSPSGRQIASGSVDCTIRVWDGHDGALILGPLEGHTAPVNSIAYSPDGALIGSGAQDFKIRVWSASDGKPTLGPLEGHTEHIRSVVCSPDGTRFISGSLDETVRVWSTNRGPGEVADPPQDQAHIRDIAAVAYSPDGSRILSCSEDGDLRFWSAQDGVLTSGPFEGYPGAVTSTPLSPDGKRILTLAADKKSIQALSMPDAAPISAPLEGHKGVISSAVYSPDGQRIISTSHDKTIRVWNANNGHPIMSPLEGHTAPVLSAVCSPNGTCIASTSKDRTIRTWVMPLSETPSERGSGATSPVALPLNDIAPESPIMPYDWRIQDDGWITSKDAGRRLFWVPFDVIDILPGPHNPFVITTRGVVRADYSSLMIGERWHECYVLP